MRSSDDKTASTPPGAPLDDCSAWPSLIKGGGGEDTAPFEAPSCTWGTWGGKASIAGARIETG
jgi:hypothetical protein